MEKILVIGAGKIGTLIATLLASSKDYQVDLADIQIETDFLKSLSNTIPQIHRIQLDANNPQIIIDYLQKKPVKAIVSSLPFYCNLAIAQAAKVCNAHYFDLTEDTQVTGQVIEIAKDAKSAFVPQCGLAPGFISIVANQLMQHFPTLDTVKMRVGALPINISNALQYSLTWSTDGLINEYGNLCRAVENAKIVDLLPLDGLEEIKIDGLTYEAFNTSGGIGSLTKTYFGKVKHLSYKTIRYPGHCAKMRFLMNDLKMNQDRETLKRILENAIPKTGQDVVLVYVSVTGMRDNAFSEENYVKKLYPKTLHGFSWSAIQLTTASSLCAVLDRVMQQPNQFRGFVRQEQFSLTEITENRFGQYYA